MGPSGDSFVGLVYDPVSESIEAGSEPGLLTTTMRFSSDILAAHDPRCATIGPGDSQGDDDKTGSELFRVGNMGVFNIEAARLGVGEEALHVPPPTVKIKTARAVVEIGCDNQQLAFGNAFSGEP